MSQMDFSNSLNYGLALTLSTFVFIFSMLGFFMVIALSLGHKNYIMNILVILEFWNKTGFYKDPQKPFHFKIVYRWLYEITISFFAALSFFFASRIWPTISEKVLSLLYRVWRIPSSLDDAILFFLVFAIFTTGIKLYYLICLRKHFRNRDEFIAALQRSKGGIYRLDWDKLIGNPDLGKIIAKAEKESNLNMGIR